MCNQKQWEPAKLFTLTNRMGLQLQVSNYGARIASIKVPVADSLREITVGFDTLAQYQENPYFGATIGPVAGRIAQGCFTLCDQVYHTEQNEGTTTLHSGKDSFETKYWSVVAYSSQQVTFSYFRRDQENGFPGNLRTTVCYRLTEDNEIVITYEAVSNQDTLFNPTNHVYFNLDGNASQSVFRHQLAVASEKVLVLAPENTTTGERIDVPNTLFDFRKTRVIDQIFSELNEQIDINQGLNHPFLVSRQDKPQVTLTGSDQKIQLCLTTDCESVVIYTIGEWAKGLATTTGPLCFGGALALEAQGAPGAERFPFLRSIYLKKGQTYQSITKYQIFSETIIRPQ